jgi:hypothetical protein
MPIKKKSKNNKEEVKKSQPMKKTRTVCQHEYIRTDGIITCAKCPILAIQYLTPLKPSI